MDLALMFDSWGITSQRQLMIDIVGRHRLDTSSLQRLNRLLHKAYHPDEIPSVLTTHMPAINGSMLELMYKVDNGADYIVELIESVR